MKYPEIVWTLRWRRDTSDALAARASELRRARSGESDRDADSRGLLAEIEQHLTAGHEACHRGRYSLAIDEYRQAQAIIYQLVDARVSRRVANRRGVDYPRERGLFKPLLRAGLELVEVLATRTSQSSFGGVLTQADESLLAKLSRFREQGVQIANPAVRAANFDTQRAAGYIEGGQWRKAEQAVERARRRLSEGAATQSREAFSALELTSAALMIQMQRPDEARTHLRNAEAAFRTVGDMAGLAQVQLNTAALFRRTGNQAAADASLQRAQEFLERAGSIATVVGGSPLAGPLGASGLGGRETASAGVVLRRQRGSTALEDLGSVVAARGAAVTYRLPGRGAGWMVQPVESHTRARERAVEKTLTLLLGDRTISVSWTVGGELPVDELIALYYREHAAAGTLEGLMGLPDSDSELAVQLPRFYLFVIPLAIGDCLHEIGDHASAERHYLQAADYEFLNRQIEAPAVWEKIARNVLDWGDGHYRREDFGEALGVYRKVVEPPEAVTTVPENAPLHRHPNLEQAGRLIKGVFEGPVDAVSDAVNPRLAAAALEVRARVMQLHAGLDFLGMPATFVPIWSFD